MTFGAEASAVPSASLCSPHHASRCSPLSGRARELIDDDVERIPLSGEGGHASSSTTTSSASKNASPCTIAWNKVSVKFSVPGDGGRVHE